MAKVFSNVLLSDAIWLEARRRNQNLTEAAGDMVRMDGKRIGRAQLARLRSTERRPMFENLMAILQWLNIFDLGQFMIDDTTIQTEPDGRITAELVSPPRSGDSRVTIGYKRPVRKQR